VSTVTFRSFLKLIYDQYGRSMGRLLLCRPFCPQIPHNLTALYQYTDFEVYASVLAGGPPSVVQRSIVGRHKQTWRLREYHLLSEDLPKSNSGINIDQDLEPLPGGDPLNSYFPQDLQIRETCKGLTIQHLNSNKTLVYQKSKLSLGSQQNSERGESCNRKVHDIIIAGEVCRCSIRVSHLFTTLF